MSEKQYLPDQEVDALVRDHLTQQEGSVDAARIVAGVRAKQVADAAIDEASSRERRAGSYRSRGRRAQRIGWRLALAAAVLFAICVSLQFSSSQASPTLLVQDAQRVHALPVDRCYLVQTQVAPADLENYRLLPAQRETRLWTRGDRFWMEPPRADRQGGWGRDEAGRVWFATPNRKAGFCFEPDEVPQGLRVACELRSMRVETLLRDILTDFDLREERSKPNNAGSTRLVHATLKPNRQRAMRSVTMEMDGESKVLKRVVLSRASQGGPGSTLTLTLIETSVQDDDVYRLKGHLDADAHIYSTEEPPPNRLQMLRRQYEMARP